MRSPSAPTNSGAAAGQSPAGGGAPFGRGGEAGGPGVEIALEDVDQRSNRIVSMAEGQERGTELYTKLLKVPGVNKAKDSGAAVFGVTPSGAGKFMTAHRATHHAHQPGRARLHQGRPPRWRPG